MQAAIRRSPRGENPVRLGEAGDFDVTHAVYRRRQSPFPFSLLSRRSRSVGGVHQHDSPRPPARLLCPRPHHFRKRVLNITTTRPITYTIRNAHSAPRLWSASTLTAKIMKKSLRFALRNRGQALVEYVLILALISAIALIALHLLGTKSKNTLNTAATALQSPVSATPTSTSRDTGESDYYYKFQS